MSGSAGHATDGLSLSVHGPAGVLDLVVPAGASAGDVAIEYAAQSRMPAVPTLLTRLGRQLDPDESLEESGVSSGSLLVALLHGSASPTVTSSRRRRTEGRTEGRTEERAAPVSGQPGPLSALWFCVSAAVALLGIGSGEERCVAAV